MIPKVKVGGLDISRLIIGTNPFFGFSHFSAARSEWLKRYFTDERIEEILECCVGAGMNATIAQPKPRYRKIMDRVEKNTGVHIVFFATPGSYPWDNWKDDIKQCADIGAEFVLPHQCFTDSALHVGRGTIERFEEIAAYIRELGMRPGLSTHKPETVVIADKAGYDVETYTQIYNSAGFLCQVETDWVGKVIREARKPVLCIKPLGSGRIMPPTALPFVFESIKPNDIVAIGMLSTEEVEEDVKITEQVLAGLHAEVALQETRSKSALK
ncbi:MAG: hypothetical protein QGD94_00580 [Planctomycetia bacterium]|nr:hypothetical protein [Planctomycetia bacterium]